jgi:Plasmid pRiA4b ORF-3-like protein
MDEKTGPAAYRIHVWIRHIKPMIWRRLAVPSKNTLADLHYAIQIAFAWTDYHLQ